ncbi:sensor histidine kinase [Nostoc sp. 'Peltigera malacea cyanobiont' DB3992]|uniref:sensor histidine kinase n=1 Tax=Nostoc sp. 'Peltigera malacea cyanobiont' DB3992 TaxID=1206980 RepID=UPI000C055036|nr:ATP-binding protein [Nostoc sp. 'Peltigera malacea cyanobiont' DB3992]PHM08229.1 histidine kinase [Nostoc sp. 'Peltigera malacea cyanobiont' DB3992]
MPEEFSCQISPPFLSEGSDRDLSLDSTLQELPMYNFSVEISHTGMEVASFLDKYPLLPGVILVEQGHFIGMISRRRLLEFLIRPFGQELFVQQPLAVLYSYVRTSMLLVTDTTSILTTMQLSLKRSPELLAEPIVVQTESGAYRLLDVQELNIISWQIRGIDNLIRYERSQAQMIQNDKMANLGRLVDGVAHEVLDPVGFIWGNIIYVSNYSQDLLKLIAAYDRELPSVSQAINEIKEEIEFDFLEQDLSRSLASIRTGAERLKKLVTSLQNFCHIDEVFPKPVDLHACIDSIILLINSRLQGEIEIVKYYGQLPPVYCFMGQLNQVLMNILSEVVDTLLNEAVRQQLNLEETKIIQKPRIEITTEVISQEASNPDAPDSRWVLIRIADNGSGMSKELQQQIIESFSLETKNGKNTSLAVSYRIITVRHGGKLNFHSQIDIGTKFEILLPLV